MSGLASLEANFRQHRSAYLAGAAGVVVLLALRARGRTAKQDTPTPTTLGNPAGPYDGTLAPAAGAPVDLSPIQQQLAQLGQQLTDATTIGYPPAPVTSGSGSAGTVVTAPGGSLPGSTLVPAAPVTVPGGSTLTGAPISFTPAPAAPTPAPITTAPLPIVDISTLPKLNPTTTASITSIPESSWTDRQRAYADLYGLSGSSTF